MVGNKETKILVVDDEPDTRMFLSNLLYSDGFSPITAENKTEGFKKAVEEKPAVVILSMMLPGEAGIHMYRHLKQDEHLKNIPVIMLSTIDRQTFFKCHTIYGQFICEEATAFDTYIKKPPEADEFLITVRELSGIR
jgi:DNA-binding response OmpR family regulator